MSVYSFSTRLLHDIVSRLRLRWLLFRRPRHVTVRGIKLPVDSAWPKELRKSLYSGNYESREAATIIDKIRKEDIVLELGAGIGFISALCARNIGSSQVHTVEANPAMMPIIQETYRLNGVGPNLIHGILSDHEGKVDFFIQPSFTASAQYETGTEAQKVRVPAIDANSLIARLRPTFLIMDIEGAEHDLLMNIDLDSIQFISIELHPGILGPEQTKAIRASLTKHGFTVDPEYSRGNVLLLERLS